MNDIDLPLFNSPDQRKNLSKIRRYGKRDVIKFAGYSAIFGSAPANSINKKINKIGYFSDLFGHPSNGSIYLDRNEYDLGYRSLLWNLSGIKLIGIKGGSSLITKSSMLLNLLDCRDCVFQDINFISLSADDITETQMLVGSYHRVLQRIRFIRCTFHCPDSYGNALKFVFERNGAFGESIHFEDCDITGAGRMGLEIQNHVDDGKSRYHDIRWEGGVVKNTGLLLPSTGMGISLTGIGSNCIVNTRFENNSYASFENVGSQSLSLSGRVKNLVRPCRPISMTNKRLMEGTSIKDFKCQDKSNGDIVIGNQINLNMSANTFMCSGMVQFIGVRNCISRNDYYQADGKCGLLITENMVEGVSSNNEWRNITIDRRGWVEGNLLGDVRFDGKDTIFNHVNKLTIRPAKKPSVIFEETRGARENSVEYVSII